MTEIHQLLSRPDHMCLQAPAGFGKTEVIAQAVSISKGKQLILTHTNAGIASLKSKFYKYGIPPSKYSIDTIASWLLKYSAAYPKLSGLAETRPQKHEEWEQIYTASMKLYQHRFIRDIIQTTYSGVFVDEYQDCTIAQHNLVLCIADMLPVRILGDPLQGIFGFKDNPLIEWTRDVLPNFKPLPELQIPWRWQKGNKDLGNFLIKLRNYLLDGDNIDLSSIPEIEWHKWSVEKEIDIGHRALNKTGSIVGIQMWPQDAHDSAKRMNGIYQSMEEMECKDLIYWAKIFDQKEGIPLAFSLINFINKCIVPDDYFSDVIKLLKANDVEGLIFIDDFDLGYAFNKLVTSRELSNIAGIVQMVLKKTKIKIFRKELLTEMKRSAQALISENYPNLYDAAWNIRHRTRVIGRKPYTKTISRTLLIKGLEFDHAIILDASKLINKQHFYVAATRGSQSLTILSENPIIKYE